VSVSSACIASGVASSTALRWIGELVQDGLVARRRDGADARRTFLEIDPAAADEVERWLQDVF
jgi:DNA-binding MarR family transcriptional regulator